MIRTFSHKGLFELFQTGTTAKIAKDLQGRSLRILDLLNAAGRAEDMQIPGLKFHPLKGNRAGFYAVSVNGPWRITFAFSDGDAVAVDLEQYH